MPPSRSVWKRLDDYQQEAVKFFETSKNAALFFEQGTGKTWITGGIIERMRHPEFVALGVVKLSNLESTWVKFLEQEVRIRVCRSLEKFKKQPGPRVLLLNYEALPRIRKKLQKLRWSLVFYDESQGLKNRSSIASRIAAQLSRQADRRLILSGTPIDERPVDLWAQFRFVAPEVFGTRWKDFEDEYLEKINIDLSTARPGSLRWHKLQKSLLIRKSKRNLCKNKLPQFMEAIRPYALRLTKSILDLPSLTFIREEIDLWGNQRNLYDEMEHDLVSTTLRLTAPLRVIQIGKLQQIAGGFVVDDDGDTHHVGNAKLRRLRRLVHRYDEPLVIFAKYIAEVLQIATEIRKAGRRVGVIRGGRGKSRGEIVEAFQSGELDVVVCQIRSGGVGIDLYRARRAIIYSTTHSHIDFDQAISRIHRRGQTKPVFIHKLIAKNTIDEAVDTALGRKVRSTNFILNQLRRPPNGRHERGQAFLQVQRRLPRRGSRGPARHRPCSAAPARHQED